MLQVLRFRSFNGGDPCETGFSDKIRVTSLQELLTTNVIERYALNERYNVVCTISNCKEEKGRVFVSQNVIPIDIDHVDRSLADEVLTTVCNFLLIDRSKTGAIYTGNGLHIFIEVTPWTDKSFFDLHRTAYNAMTRMLQEELKKNALPGDVDQNFFAPTRTTRVPGSINDKTHKGGERKKVEVIQSNLELQDFDVTTFKSMADLQDEAKKTYGRIDTDSVLECPFLVHCKENAADILEPEWHAMIGVLSFMENGEDLCHEYSKGHPKYRPEETNKKIMSCAKMTGPRTCANIATLFDGCKSCKHLGKVTSPLQIKNDDYIETLEDGFHKILVGKNGIIRYVPVPQDLVKYFNKLTPYVTEASGAVYRCTPPYQIWSQVSEVELNEFATVHYRPSANNNMRSEFRGEIAARNVVSDGYFLDANRGFLNLKNGVLDIHKRELLPHNPEFRFMYHLDYDYDPTADCPNFKRALHAIMCRDEALCNIFLEFLGLCVSGDSNKRFEKALILTGQGSNGKSTLIDMIRSLLGRDNCASHSINSLKNAQVAVSLRGKLANLVPEMESDDFDNSAYFKSLISGEPQAMKILYAQPFSERIDSKFIMSCNTLPTTRDWTHGMMRRLLLIPLHARFNENQADFDRDINRKFDNERSGILNLAIEGYMRLNKNNGFTRSSVADLAITNYRQVNDSVHQFAESKLEVGEEFQAPQDQVYKAYVEYCREMNLKPLAIARFTPRLEEYAEGIEASRMMVNKVRKIFYKNVRLTGVSYGF